MFSSAQVCLTICSGGDCILLYFFLFISLHMVFIIVLLFHLITSNQGTYFLIIALSEKSLPTILVRQVYASAEWVYWNARLDADHG